MLRRVSSLSAAAALVARRALPARPPSQLGTAACCHKPTATTQVPTRLHGAFGSSSNLRHFKCWDDAYRRLFSSGDDDDDGATTDFASALETFWSPAVQQQLQAVAAGLPAVQENLSTLSPGGAEYVKQMRRVETLSTLDRMLQQLLALQGETQEMEALAQEAMASGDAAMGEEAQNVTKRLIEDAKTIKLELLKFLVPHDEADSMDAVLELRAGVGGGEASLWCSEMCGMYQRFCEQKGWDFEIVSSASTDSGGMREVRSRAAFALQRCSDVTYRLCAQ